MSDLQCGQFGRATSRSRPIPNSLWGRRAPIWPIPPSRSCSSRPNISRNSARSLPRGESGAHGTRNLGGASERRQWRSRRQAGVRNRQGALPRPRAWRKRADRDAGRAAVDQFGRSRARSDLRAAPSHSRGAPGPRFASRSGPWRREPAKRCWIASTNIGTRRPMSAQRRWRGPRRRCSFIISASNPARRDFFNASRAMSSSPAAICAPRRRSFVKAPVRNPVCGLRASPAICRSCCCESRKSKLSMSPVRCCKPTNIGG